MKILSTILVIVLFLPSLGLAQDLDLERRIELMENEIAMIKRIVKAMAANMDLLEMKLKEQSNDVASSLPDDHENDAQLKSWVVYVSVNTTPNINAQQAEIGRENDLLFNLKGDWEHAREQAKWNKTSDNAIDSELQGRAARLGNEFRRKMAFIAKLNRELDYMRQTRSVSGHTKDNKPFAIEARGKIEQIAESMHPGKWYTVWGSSKIYGGIIHITMSAASKTKAPTGHLQNRQLIQKQQNILQSQDEGLREFEKLIQEQR